MKDEIKGVVRLFDEVYSTFGLKYEIELSTMPVDHIGTVEQWEHNQEILKEADVYKRQVYSFTSEINSMGMTPSSTILEFEVMSPPPDIVSMLELESSSVKIYRFSRIRNVNGQPLILETSFYPTYIYPKLTRELLETHSFYSLLYEEGIVPYSAVDSYEAVILGRREAELLGTRPGSCAFSVQRRTRTESGSVYEFTQSLIRADRVTLDVHLHKDGVSFARNVDK